MKGDLFEQDNASLHKPLFTMHVCGFKLVDPSLQSPDYTSSDYHLFPNEKTIE